MEKKSLITVLGPTASGKTAFAAQLAYTLDGEIVSADSRQIYRRMDIGTGKDLSEYNVEGSSIPYHLIDIREPGEKYTLFDYQHDFHKTYRDILGRDKTPILCGGTGLYIESVLKGYNLPDVPPNPGLRLALDQKSLEELTDILQSYRPLHNTTDTDSKKRAIRAIEIEEHKSRQKSSATTFPAVNSILLGLDIDRELRRQKITARLHARLQEGMIEEVRSILDSGVSPEDLIYYGLEYKFVTLHVTGKLSYEEMFRQLEIAIHQFAKRQMTWFRGMERRGFFIHWIDATLPMEQKLHLAHFFTGKKS
ncbi:tRNA (adenosine(37)-N6)-dimethylallyltransferase MiaA [Proteiniphilum sp. X52]|uniref:tRNA (adenosine(37)-N6)-dimethylallyltransferase MiaA n=1 Tax=Proteiniphilum sp. X52 TaxID=2382159 RepID=UPI000F09BF66|nr:tRNA (adenosine(37)-N6)-dimethylallyltransferase MiaA [Proteiniphilum sp. X52]RNC66908.1 tRNA (adenosine(37)-N6)-dimethylallyltransferase MiaA [Proteiniphilum sp. X52]